jgi:WD40 repeat protein
MRYLLAFLSALWCIGAPQGFTQEEIAAIPPRFQALAKNDRFRLLRVLGTPELAATYGQTSAFSADGKRAIYAEDLSTGAAEMPHLRTRLLLWDVPAKAWPREFEIAGKSVTALCLSADGRRVLLAGQTFMKKGKKDNDPRSYVTLYDLDAGREIHTILTKENYLQCVALAPDETTALASSVDKLKRWDLKEGKEIGVFQDKGLTMVTALAFLPDGKQFLAGYQGDKGKNEILRWDIQKQKSVAAYVSKAKEFGNVWHLAVARDGKRFASADLQPSISLWETDTGKEINTLRIDKRTVEEIITAVALSDDSRTVLSVWGKSEPAPDDFACARLIAWDGEANKTLWSHAVPYRGRPPLLVQGEKLLTGGGPNLFDVWNIKDGKRLDSWGGHKGTVNALAGLANGDILSAGQEGVVMTWSKGQLAGKWAAHAGAISAMAMSRDQKQWLTAGGDQTIKLWSAGAGEPVHVFKGHTGPVMSLAISNDGRWACSGAGDRGVKTRNLTTGKEIATFTGHSEGVNAVAISPDDRWIASASDDTTIRLWPIKDGKLDPDREVITLEDHKKAVLCLAFSPDGKTLVSGSQDQTLIVWDWTKEKSLRTIPGHKNWITSLLFVDADTVVTTSDDLTVCWWELAFGKEIGRLDFGAVGDCPRCLARIGPDRLLVGSSSWLIYELQILPAAKSKTGAGSSK